MQKTQQKELIDAGDNMAEHIGKLECDIEQNLSATSTIVTQRSMTMAEKRRVVCRIQQSGPPMSDARRKEMSRLRQEFEYLDNPPFICKTYRTQWSKWVSAEQSHTKAKPLSHSRDVVDGIENLDDMSSHFQRTGNGSTRSQVRRNVQDIRLRRSNYEPLTLDQMRRQMMIADTNCVTSNKADAGARTEARHKATTYQNGIGECCVSRRVARYGPRHVIYR